MPELFGGTVITEIPDNEKLALGRTGVAGSKNIIWSAFKTFLATLFLSRTGDATVSGNVTFSGSIKVPTPTTANDAVNYGTISGISAATKVPFLSRTVDFNYLLTANRSIERVDLSGVSGTANVKISTPGGDGDIMPEQTVSDSDDENKVIKLGKSFKADKTLTVSISGGGTVSVNIWYLPALF